VKFVGTAALGCPAERSSADAFGRQKQNRHQPEPMAIAIEIKKEVLLDCAAS
jgi:hypothetical protein